MAKEPLIDFFRGDGVARPQPAIRSLVLSDEVLAAQTDPAGYRLTGDHGQAVTTAVNVALLLRSALLVSGEPGSGKTQLAYAIAHELGRPPPLKFVVKSTSQAGDLIYAYDAVQHFRASQAGAAADARDYIHYSALGLAILIAQPLEVRRRFLGSAVFDAGGDAALAPDVAALRALLRASEPRQMIVLIDEIDKAPRDFPNDLLDEVDTLSFRVPELGGAATPALPAALRPIIVITTNAERPLPDAFLRRCVFTHLSYPTGEALDELLASRLQGVFAVGAPLLRDVRRFFEAARERRMLEKDPSTSELIQFLQALSALGADHDRPIAGQAELVRQAAPAIAKSRADLERLSTMIADWRSTDGGVRPA